MRGRMRLSLLVCGFFVNVSLPMCVCECVYVWLTDLFAQQICRDLIKHRNLMIADLRWWRWGYFKIYFTVIGSHTHTHTHAHTPTSTNSSPHEPCPQRAIPTWNAWRLYFASFRRVQPCVTPTIVYSCWSRRHKRSLGCLVQVQQSTVSVCRVPVRARRWAKADMQLSHVFSQCNKVFFFFNPCPIGSNYGTG